MMKRYELIYRDHVIEVSGLDNHWQVNLAAGGAVIPLPEVKYVLSSSEEAAIATAKKFVDDFLDGHK